MLVAKLPVPDECIDLVIAYLPEDRQALHGLVLACRKLFQRAVPVLYRSPFALIDAHNGWSEHEKEKRYLILLALLLNSRINRTSGDCLCDNGPDTRARSINPSTTTSTYYPPLHPYTVDYLRFYTHQFPVNLWRPLTNLRSVPLTPLVLSELTGKTLAELQTEIAHSLIEYHPRDIRVLGQPIARTPILLQSIQHLHNLMRLELSEIAFGCKVEPILEFIRVHDAMHNTLREIKIKSPEEATLHYEPTHTQLVRIVQAMRNPQVVDARHWREAIMVLDQIPVDCLKTLLLGLAEMPPNQIATSEFLAQCVFLENVRMPVRDSQLFLWAVEARKKTTLTGSTIGGGSRHNMVPYYAAPFVGATPSMAYLTSGPLSPWAHSYTDWLTGEEHFGPARLKSVELCGEDRVLIPALKDATDAFRDSLEQIKGISLALLMSRVTVNIMNTLSWSWPMEQLSVIDLEGEVALAFDLAVLQFCPLLTTLRLSLPPYLFSTSEDDKVLQELTAYMPQILLARHLLDLELYGKWPLSDALLVEMGRRMPRLRRLYIGYCLGYTHEGVQALLDGIDENGHGTSRLEWVAVSRWIVSSRRSNDSRIRHET